MNDITGIILAGGKSSRMGKDKALLKIRNKTLTEILYETLSFFCSEIIISTNNPEVKINGTISVCDEIHDIGPAGGIISSLNTSTNEKNIIISVDTPFVSIELLKYLTDNSDKEIDITILSEKGALQPLIGIYKKNVAKTFLSESEKGNYKVRNVIKLLNSKIIDISNLSFYNSRLLININKSDDYISALNFVNAKKE
ncbi:MAG: molybdenum cofactor guanylyltransferase [Bacteroidales bacterium]|nr:molybdenum cofactor guanylyltransferase [Bacteroidales bacterium]